VRIVTRRLHYPALLLACFAFGYFAVPSHAKSPTHGIGTAVIKLNPDYGGTCNFAHRMDIQIIDGVWFECMCIALANGWDCAWVELPEPAVTGLRKRIKVRHLRPAAYMPRRVVFA
jgi:hypothetical protein